MLGDLGLEVSSSSSDVVVIVGIVSNRPPPAWIGKMIRCQLPIGVDIAVSTGPNKTLTVGNGSAESQVLTDLSFLQLLQGS